ncbi:oxoglutarate dehydrogenase (succinyl-transferring), E1 component [Candidatus Endolissoclinum faulkneri L5]|uniref:2-oxoglutarate dehydrogenase E1 component n=1 Tax=Candidatus Endolissoclinum faulkneri L5 TaxID=1401328 RepID=V9TTQ0_9PROT|nr:2-oxoglutarate dehydrogenase E1 component [Candidatus Endolissoclinum faulkneri]AHC73981.1 oxoglutarate dehydrogenase (succinyl-transferring), E1 component [Candidatus Endolissoclinum faulkneri L5]
MSIEYHDCTFLNGVNASFISELFAKYLENHNAVDSSWHQYFDLLNDDIKVANMDLRGPSFATRTTKIITAVDSSAPEKALEKATVVNPQWTDSALACSRDSLRASMIIQAYRVNGHLKANLDPLGLKNSSLHPELNPETYGFTKNDWNRPIFINNMLGLERTTLSEIMNVLESIYCRSIGVEFMHIQDLAQKTWILERIEQQGCKINLTPIEKKIILQRITAAESFEKFLAIKCVGVKRFGLDGGETLIPALEQILIRSSELGLEEAVLGMPHRGRLSVLCNFMNKPFRAIVAEFLGKLEYTDQIGDVKYHMGFSSNREFNGINVHLTLNSNPSHLESVNSVVLGRVRAKQEQKKDKLRQKVMGILMHGDAAFVGQGVAAETLELSGLHGYRTGGTIHIIINNQIGFTTDPQHARSSVYPTDMGKMVLAPIFHVNADDPEATVHVARIAAEFRHKFNADVIINIICYRRFGHNETDEPRFTQPLMYEKICHHQTTREIYVKQLIDEGTLDKQEVDKILDEEKSHLMQEFEYGLTYKPGKADWLEGAWSNLKSTSGEGARGNTGVDIKELQRIGAKLCDVPKGFNLHSKLNRFIASRKKAIASGEGIDWATSEALSFATLLTDGFMVRLSGQDSQRGTFSQRHSVYIDQKTEKSYIPLNNIQEKQANYEVINSPLSEAGVLCFEYGYSQAEPNTLICWEAQFGDFANVAQVVMDQFITSGEKKWLRMSGLVLLLPHGYEGQGPEHSSARIERFLQLCGEDNMQVVNCTTPANYFHVLRRQMHRDFRKPLIIFTPKSILRHKMAVSKLEEISGSTTFHRVLFDDRLMCEDKEVKRVIICSGKVYYDLYEESIKRNINNIVFLRLEQMYPFPREVILHKLSRFPQAEIIWCQEEPANMGPWTFVDRRIEDVLIEIDGMCKRPQYIGRPISAAPATGSAVRHTNEQAALVNKALTLNLKKFNNV